MSGVLERLAEELADLNPRELDWLWERIQLARTSCQICRGANGMPYALFWRGWDSTNRRSMTKAAGALLICDPCWEHLAAPRMRKHPVASAQELRDSLRPGVKFGDSLEELESDQMDIRDSGPATVGEQHVHADNPAPWGEFTTDTLSEEGRQSRGLPGGSHVLGEDFTAKRMAAEWGPDSPGIRLLSESGGGRGQSVEGDE